MLSKYFTDVVTVSHKVKEEEFKNHKYSPKRIVLRIAKEKTLSVVNTYPNEMVIASDQILICDNKILSKPKTIKEAKQKLLFLKNKTHHLYSSIYVMRKQKFYFQQVKVASLAFANISLKVLESYVKSNKKTVLTTVGSYKIEENSKYKFITTISGDQETILGFPIHDLIEKIKHEE